MSKAENKLARPIEMTELDRTKLQLASERTRSAAIVHQTLIDAENALKLELRAKYKLGDSDEVNFQTGAITRKP